MCGWEREGGFPSRTLFGKALKQLTKNIALEIPVFYDQKKVDIQIISDVYFFASFRLPLSKRRVESGKKGGEKKYSSVKPKIGTILTMCTHPVYFSNDIMS